MSRISALKVTDTPDGAHMRVHLEWTDEAGERREIMFAGMTGDRITAEIDDMTARSEDARAGYLLGLARGVTYGEHR